MREKDEHAITPLCCVSRVARTDARVEQKVNKREGVESYVWLLHREQQATTSSYPITSQYTLRQRGERAHSCWRSVTDFFFSHSSLLSTPPPPPRLSHYTLSLYRPVVAVGFDVPAPPPCPQPPPCPPRRVHGTSTGPSITRPLGIGCLKWPGAGVAVVAEVTYPRRKVIRTFFFCFFLFWFFAASWKFAGVYPPTEGGRFVCASFLLGLFRSS